MPESLFRIGSATKMLTAATHVTLAEEGKLDLNAPIGNYVKGLISKVAQVTAHQLLSQTSGIKDIAGDYGLHEETALAGVLLMSAAQFGGRQLELAFGAATKVSVMFAHALSPAVVHEGISETDIKGVIAYRNQRLFDRTIAKSITPVKEIVDAHTTTGDHCDHALSG